MTKENRELYDKTVARLKRAGVDDPTAQLLSLAREIEIYRDEIRAMRERSKPNRWTSYNSKDDCYEIRLPQTAEITEVFNCRSEPGEKLKDGLGATMGITRDTLILRGPMIDTLGWYEEAEALVGARKAGAK